MHGGKEAAGLLWERLAQTRANSESFSCTRSGTPRADDAGAWRTNPGDRATAEALNLAFASVFTGKKQEGITLQGPSPAWGGTG